jgi:hypothetical protein
LLTGVIALFLMGYLGPSFWVFLRHSETNPSKIASGFGGTLCVVLSFLYILAFVLLFGFWRSRTALPHRLGPGKHCAFYCALDPGRPVNVVEPIARDLLE